MASPTTHPPRALLTTQLQFPAMRDLHVRGAAGKVHTFRYDGAMNALELKNRLEALGEGPASHMKLLWAGHEVPDSKRLADTGMVEYHLQNECTMSLEVSLVDKLTLFIRAGNRHLMACRVEFRDTIAQCMELIEDTATMRIFTGMYFAEDDRNIVVKSLNGVTFVKLIPEPSWTLRQLKDAVLNYGIVAQNFTFDVADVGDLHIYVHPSVEPDTSAQYYVRDTRPNPEMPRHLNIPPEQRYDQLVHDICVGPCLDFNKTVFKCGEEVLARIKAADDAAAAAAAQ